MILNLLDLDSTPRSRSRFTMSPVATVISRFCFLSQLYQCLDLGLVVADMTKDFYCSEDNTDVKIQGTNTGRIITLIERESTYRNEMKCTWIIETDPNNRIQFQVESSHLQQSPSNSICEGYDHVDIKEGSDLLASWCGDKFPKVINTKGNRAKIIFSTDESNPPSYSFRGARLRFEVFNKSSCPPGWQMNEDFCYSKGHKRDKWANSQSDCNRGQANLLSIETQEEFAFITQAFLNNLEDDEFVWTGFNDVSKAGTFRWLDSTIPEEIGSMALPYPSKFYRCGALRAADQHLMMKDCERDKFSYLCKANRTNVTTLYSLPKTKTNKGSGKSSSSSRFLLGILVSAALLLSAIVLGIFVYRKCRARFSDPEAFIKRIVDNNSELFLQRVNLRDLQSQREQDQDDIMPSAPPAYEEALSHRVVI